MQNQSIGSLYSIESEKSILGTIIIDATKRNYISKLNENLFFDTNHKTILKAISQIIEERDNIDTISIIDKAEKMGHNIDYSFVLQLQDFCIPSAIDHHIKILKEKEQRRRIYKILQQAMGDVLNCSEDITGITSTIAARLDNASIVQKYKDGSMKGLSMRLFNKLQDKQSKEELEKYYYGIPELDRLTAGLQKGEKTTIAAKSGIGKTAFALQIGRRLSTNKLKVLFVSREMSDLQVGNRILSSLTGIDSVRLKKKDFNDLEWKEITKALNFMSNQMNMFIDDESNTVTQIKAKLRETKADVLIVDYLQLMTPEKDEKSREREVATISRELKNISLSFDIPVVDLSQLNDEMGDKRPHGERVMRESKAVYHDSNNVIYLHRPSEDEIEKIYGDDKNPITPGAHKHMESIGVKLVEVILDKQRDGSTGSFLQYYISEKLQFVGVK
ncbi:MAG: replicative DNA helicase [Bacillota bacterium]